MLVQIKPVTLGSFTIWYNTETKELVVDCNEPTDVSWPEDISVVFKTRGFPLGEEEWIRGLNHD